jgi:hypothetical protein
VKAADLRARPQASAAYLEGEEFGAFTHGDAEFPDPGHQDLAFVDEHLTSHHGRSPSFWGRGIVYVRVTPRWMVSCQHNPSGAQA